MNRFITFLIATSFGVSAFAYDPTQAKELEKFYAHMTQEAFAKSKLNIEADEVMQMVRENKDFVLLDIRTEGEMSVVALQTPNAIEVPLNKLFETKNLDKLPTNKPIVVVCHSGSRALLASIELKKIGFKNIRLLKGGLAALSVADNVKNAPLK